MLCPNCLNRETFIKHSPKHRDSWKRPTDILIKESCICGYEKVVDIKKLDIKTNEA